MGTVWGNGVVFWSLEQMPVSRNRCMFFVIALCPVLYHFEFKDTGRYIFEMVKNQRFLPGTLGRCIFLYILTQYIFPPL
jgi:hypothetical protein